MFNFKILFGPQYWFRGHRFNDLKSTLSYDTCIITQFVALLLLRRIFIDIFLIYSYVQYLGAPVFVWGQYFDNLESSL